MVATSRITGSYRPGLNPVGFTAAPGTVVIGSTRSRTRAGLLGYRRIVAGIIAWHNRGHGTALQAGNAGTAIISIIALRFDYYRCQSIIVQSIGILRGTGIQQYIGYMIRYAYLFKTHSGMISQIKAQGKNLLAEKYGRHHQKTDRQNAQAENFFYVHIGKKYRAAIVLMVKKNFAPEFTCFNYFLNYFNTPVIFYPIGYPAAIIVPAQKQPRKLQFNWSFKKAFPGPHFSVSNPLLSASNHPVNHLAGL